MKQFLKSTVNLQRVSQASELARQVRAIIAWAGHPESNHPEPTETEKERTNSQKSSFDLHGHAMAHMHIPIIKLKKKKIT